MKRLILVLAIGFTFALSARCEEGDAKKALQAIGEFAGEWKGDGVAKIDGKEVLWNERLKFGWVFDKKDDKDNTHIKLEIKDGKYFESGIITPRKKKNEFRLVLTDKDKKEFTYDGEFVRNKLILKRTDDKSGDVHRLTIYTVSEGARIMFFSEVQAKGKGLFTKEFEVSGGNAAESFAGGAKKPVCIITGGLGTIPVTYNGKTYYVCCSGCRDEFNANPKKFVDEFEKGK